VERVRVGEPPPQAPGQQRAHGRLAAPRHARHDQDHLVRESRGYAEPVYDIQNPSFAGFVTTQDHGVLDLFLISIGPNGTWLERPV
jgi:hypothetical protein